MNQIRTINLNKENVTNVSAPTIVSRLLPIFLVISFAFASSYNTIRNMSTNLFGLFSSSTGMVLFVQMAIVGLVDYLIFLLSMWVYKSILKTRPYFALVGERKFGDIFGLCYVCRNICVGLFGLSLFFAPYLAAYMPIVSMIFSFVAINVAYVFMCKHMDIMFRHFLYRILFLPWFVWHALTAIFAIIFGGTIL